MMITWCVWLNSLVICFNVKTCDIWERKHDNKEWDLNWEHLFPRVLGYKKKSDIKEVDDREFRVVYVSVESELNLLAADSMWVQARWSQLLWMCKFHAGRGRSSQCLPSVKSGRIFHYRMWQGLNSLSLFTHQLKLDIQISIEPHSVAMNRENRLLVTDEPVEFEELPFEVQDIRKITDRFRGIYRIYLNLMKKTQRCQYVSGWTWKH